MNSRFAPMGNEDNVESNLDDVSTLGFPNRSRDSSLIEDYNQYFSTLNNNMSSFGHNGNIEADSSTSASATGAHNMNGYSGPGIGEPSTIFSFTSTSLNNNTTMSIPENKSSSPTIPSNHDQSYPINLYTNLSSYNPNAASYQPLYNQPMVNMGTRSPGKPLVTTSDQATDRDTYQTNSRPSSHLNYPWSGSDTNSDIIDAPYDIYRSDYLSAHTRQRQHSDPIVPLNRNRQNSDPTHQPIAYRHQIGYYQQPQPNVYPLQQPKVPPNSMSTTPERGMLVDSHHNRNGPIMMTYFPMPPPKSISVDINSRGRSVSESGTLVEGQTIQQYYRPNGINNGYNSNRGLTSSILTCSTCHATVKRNQSVCFRCHTSIPISHTSSNGDMRNLYHSHPSDASLNSDTHSHISSHSSHHSSHHSSQHSHHSNNMYDNSSATVLLPKEPTMREGDWLCQYCHGHNFATKIACFTCHAARPGFERGIPIGQMEALGIGRLGGSSAEAKPGDWTCPKCHENVFAKRNRCYRCTTSRPRKLSH